MRFAAPTLCHHRTQQEIWTPSPRWTMRSLLKRTLWKSMQLEMLHNCQDLQGESNDGSNGCWGICFAPRMELHNSIIGSRSSATRKAILTWNETISPKTGTLRHYQFKTTILPMQKANMHMDSQASEGSNDGGVSCIQQKRPGGNCPSRGSNKDCQRNGNNQVLTFHHQSACKREI